jgi:DNA-binding response OmpR family regulator
VELAKRIQKEVSRRKMTVAVIDDDETLRVILVDLLSSLGFKVRQSPGGREFLEVHCHEKFDIVVISWNAKNSASVVDILTTAAWPRPHLIVVSGEDETHSFRLGMVPDAFIFRPFNTETVLRAIAEAIGGGDGQD